MSKASLLKSGEVCLVIFRHHVKRDKSGKYGLCVRKSLKTKDEHLAMYMVNNYKFYTSLLNR